MALRRSAEGGCPGARQAGSWCCCSQATGLPWRGAGLLCALLEAPRGPATALGLPLPVSDPACLDTDLSLDVGPPGRCRAVPSREPGDWDRDRDLGPPLTHYGHSSRRKGRTGQSRTEVLWGGQRWPGLLRLGRGLSRGGPWGLPALRQGGRARRPMCGRRWGPGQGLRSLRRVLGVCLATHSGHRPWGPG